MTDFQTYVPRRDKKVAFKVSWDLVVGELMSLPLAVQSLRPSRVEIGDDVAILEDALLDQCQMTRATVSITRGAYLVRYRDGRGDRYAVVSGEEFNAEYERA